MSAPMVKQWHGQIGKLMQEHLALRASVGRIIRSETIVLHQFNHFLHRQYPKLKTPNRYTILHFLDTKKHLTPWGRRNNVIHVRQFCRFLNQRGISCYVPDKTLTPKLAYNIRYFPLHPDDAKALIGGMRLIRPNKPFVGKTYSTMIGLLWCTGMRRKEVISFNHGDINFKEMTILIRETKFRKTRMIPIDKSVATVLEKYFLIKKEMGYPIGSDAPFFVNLTGTRVRGGNLMHAFKRAAKKIGLCNENGKSPCLHDLRHNFATQTLKKLYSDGEKWPSETILNILATYLGHSEMRYSQYYLHPDFDLLMEASKRFENKRKEA